MDDDDNWDLNAVVRSCTAATQTSTAATPNPIMTGPEEEESFSDWLKPEELNDPLVSFPSDLLEPRANAFQELQQFYESFFPNPTTTNNPPTTNSYAPPIIPNSHTISDFRGPAAATSGLQQQHHAQAEQQHQFLPTINNPIMCRFGYQYHQQPLLLPKPENQTLPSHHQPPPGFIGKPLDGPGPMPIMRAPVPLPRFPHITVPYPTPRTRKKKCQQKRVVVEVSAENLSADLWAWRKYGQKPIKGSPHPRNYYRCSSEKGCGARKQVERSVKEPEIFVVTYTGEHTHPRPTHRNSLAGSTRNRLSSTKTSQTQPIINHGSSSTPPAMPSPLEQFTNQDAALVNEVSSSGDMLGKELNDEEHEDGKGDHEMDEDDVMMRDVAAEEEEEEEMFMGQNKRVGCTSSSSGSGGSSWASANHSSWEPPLAVATKADDNGWEYA